MWSASESGSSCPKYTQEGCVMHSSKWKPSPAALPWLHSSGLLGDCKRRERTPAVSISVFFISARLQKGGAAFVPWQLLSRNRTEASSTQIPHPEHWDLARMTTTLLAQGRKQRSPVLKR